jgi:predicted DNA-binding transcriptional regulator YafY
VNDYLEVGFRKVRGKGPAKTVRLRFAPKAARYVREKKSWHPTQKFQEHPDGSLTMTFRVNQLLEVKRWVLSWGADCEVLRPNVLQAEVMAEVGKLRDSYQRKLQVQGVH